MGFCLKILIKGPNDNFMKCRSLRLKTLYHVQLSLMKLCDRRKLFMLKMMYRYSQRQEYVEP